MNATHTSLPVNVPTNINEARRLANSYARAQQILDEGYTFWQDADTQAIAVVKPGTTAAAYWIDDITPGCGCPDYMQRGEFCKHTLAWQIVQEEAAMWDAICAEHDAQNA